MNVQHKILPAVCCIALMSACASNQSTSAVASTIKLSAATTSSNDKPEAMYQLGRYYQGQNRFYEAANAYMKALSIDANFVEARNGLGVIYSRQAKYTEAIEAFQIAIHQAPGAAHLYSNMGYTYYLQGKYAESVKALQQATALDPNNQRALHNLAQAYAKAGNTTQSAHAFSDAIIVEKPTNTLEQAAASFRQTPSNVTNIMAATVEDSNAASIAAKPVPMVLPVVESRVRLVSLTPHISELQLRPQAAEIMEVATDETLSNAKKLRFEVANGNGMSGAAAKISKFLHGHGYAVARLTNQKPFKTQSTQIYYRSGYEAQARLLQSKLLDPPALFESNHMRANVSVKIVLGKDIVTQLAHYEHQTNIVHMVLNSSESKSGIKQLY